MGKPVYIGLTLFLLGAAPQAAAIGGYPNAYFSPTWTPGGTTLVYRANTPARELRRVTLDGAVSTLASESRFESPVRVSRLGEVAYVTTSIDVVSPVGKLTVRTAPGRARVVASALVYGGLDWSPDGNEIVFAAPSGSLAIVSAAGGTPRELPVRGSDPSWAPSGTQIAFFRGSETAVLDLASGIARRVGSTFLFAGGFHSADDRSRAAWSPDERLLALQTNAGAEIVRSDGGGAAALLRGATAPSWSPDGSEIAFERGQDIVASKPDGSHERIVVASAMSESAPTWSPDGRWIAFTNGNVTPPEQAFQEGHAADVFVIRPDGSGRRSLTGGCGVGPKTPIEWICVVNGRWAVPLRDASAPRLTIAPRFFPRAIRFPVFVTDGLRYVYGALITVRQVSGPRVRVTSVDGKAPSLLSDTGGRAAFRFLKPHRHGTVTLQVTAAGQSQRLVLRV